MQVLAGRKRNSHLFPTRVSGTYQRIRMRTQRTNEVIPLGSGTSMYGKFSCESRLGVQLISRLLEGKNEIPVEPENDVKGYGGGNFRVRRGYGCRYSRQRGICLTQVAPICSVRGWRRNIREI
jgi:hypothetical protein